MHDGAGLDDGEREAWIIGPDLAGDLVVHLRRALGVGADRLRRRLPAIPNGHDDTSSLSSRRRARAAEPFDVELALESGVYTPASSRGALCRVQRR
jgi:hypothetical protein